MSRQTTNETWAALAESDGSPRPQFDPATAAGLPDPARRLLARTLPSGTPLHSGVELTMTGEIKLASRWLPFTAEQILRGGVGFVWKPTVGGRLLRFTGDDSLGPGGARLEFRLHGVIPVARAAGPDTARSAVGRLAAETVAWLPQALCPQMGAEWSPVDDDRAVVSLPTGRDGSHVDVEVTVAPDGRLQDLHLQRWQDSAKPPRFAPFGGAVSDEFITPVGVRIAGTGVVGWNWRTADQPDGEFFRYTITSARPI